MQLACATGRALLSLFFPLRCLLCQAEGDQVEWVAAGPRVAGLRPWDHPQLCRRCYQELRSAPRQVRLPRTGARDLVVVAGTATTSPLVSLLAGLKYHGQRGVAWPLCELMAPAITDAIAVGGDVDALTAVPLHWRRHRERGFNQAAILGRLLARRLQVPFRDDAVRRRRGTAHQARLPSPSRRRQHNVQGAFLGSLSPADGSRLGLVDDLVTTGATAAAVADALAAAGWDVRWVVAAGLPGSLLAAQSPLDTEHAHS